MEELIAPSQNKHWKEDARAKADVIEIVEFLDVKILVIHMQKRNQSEWIDANSGQNRKEKFNDQPRPAKCNLRADIDSSYAHVIKVRNSTWTSAINKRKINVIPNLNHRYEEKPTEINATEGGNIALDKKLLIIGDFLSRVGWPYRDKTPLENKLQ